MVDYLIDTHIAIWLLNDSKNLNDSIREDIMYYQHQYHISQFSLLEILHLQQLGKIDLKSGYDEIISQFNKHFISVDSPDGVCFNVLENMPLLEINGRLHSDMIDRYIISMAIANKYTLISADQKFPYYRQFGLRLIEN